MPAHRANKRLTKTTPFFAQAGGYQTAIVAGIGEVDGFALQDRLRQLLGHLLRVGGVGDLLELERTRVTRVRSLQTELAVAASGFIPVSRSSGAKVLSIGPAGVSSLRTGAT
jgi:hypothetical protein